MQADPSENLADTPSKTAAATDTRLDTTELRRRIAQADRALADEFWAGADIDALVAERGRFIDAFLAEIWQHWFEHNDNLALLAVGGYGRGELHPHSDIDLLILAKKPSAVQDEIAAFVRLLWDLKLDIGHSVRTLADCKREAARDVVVYTTMMERRRLAGSHLLTAKLDKVLARKSIWPRKRFFRAKQQEQDQRHRQYDHVDYDLEPNLKGSPGGLRDIQTILWITQHDHRSRDLDELVAAGFLTPLEAQWLAEGRRFIWRVRFGLHLIAKRKEDRLLFDYQRELARRFGYRDTDAQLGVEQFMHDYYRHVLLLREVNDILLQHFDEAILRAGERPKIERVNERFHIHNHYIEASHDNVFKTRPASIMEMFVVMANRNDIAGVRASTIRLVRNHLHLIDDAFRNDSEVTAYFMDLLRAPYTVVSQLTRMRRYGVLGRYIPEFGQVVGQMQHDLFHIYTVDAHTMMVIRQMRRLLFRSATEKFPLAARVAHKLPKIELLYVAGLFHDIGKGRGGDHSDLGAADVVRFCRRHGLSEEDTTLVEWLVRAHLTMSATAQRQDIHDPDVVREFARRVGNETRLDYLYALTVADINATNPTLWNGWRATLLGQLYQNTRQQLQEGLDALRERAAACRESAIRALARHGIDADRARALWDDPDDDFFVHHSPEQVVAITQAIDGHDIDAGPLVTVLEVADEASAEGATEVFLYGRDRDGLFADSVRAIDSANLRVAAARIATSVSGTCFNSYIVLGIDGAPVADGKRTALAQSLTRAMHGDSDAQTLRHVSRQLKQFVMPTEVALATDPGARTSTLRVVASDRPGLLATLGGLFEELDISVRRARITTLGERVEDVFEITNRAQHPITHPGLTHAVTETIRSTLDAEIARSHADQADSATRAPVRR
ncbi:MAG: [protein-PII] uridylyltransferase [Pseudomonadales bacterium]|nr:[protein-PII] uridylyltransferase [Pseudomonadales bacterium]